MTKRDPSPEQVRFTGSTRKGGLHGSVLRSFLLVCAMCWILFVWPDCGAAFEGRQEVLHGNGATVVCAPSLRRVGEELLEAYPSVRSELEKSLRWKIEFDPTVVLIADREKFQSITGRSQIVALAIPARNLIVLDRSRLRSPPSILNDTLKHELCHLLLHARVPADHLPLWLDEGIAQWSSDGLSELGRPIGGSVLDEAALSGRIIPLRFLSRAFSRDGKSLVLAYEQSKSLVQFIIDRFGLEGLYAILDRLAQGAAVEKAFLESISISPDELEAAWNEDLEDKLAWTGLFFGHLYEILFFVASLMVVAGFLRHLRRKRAAMAELDDEDDRI